MPWSKPISTPRLVIVLDQLLHTVCLQQLLPEHLIWNVIMARLPRYRGIGVQANIPRSVDYAGFRGEAAAGQAMSAAFDQMSGFLYKTAQQDAMQAGLGVSGQKAHNLYSKQYKPRAVLEV